MKRTKKEDQPPEPIHMGEFILLDTSDPRHPIGIHDFWVSIPQAEQFRFELDETIRRAHAAQALIQQSEAATN